MSADTQADQLAKLQAELNQAQVDYDRWNDRAGNMRALAAEQEPSRAGPYLRESAVARAQASAASLKVAGLMLAVEDLRGKIEDQRLQDMSNESFLARISGRAPLLTAEQVAEQHAAVDETAGLSA